MQSRQSDGRPQARNTRAPGSDGKRRLPKLRPNVNRRAQQIITAHLQSTDDNASSTATVPVLTKLESTAPNTARTHDISHLCDQPKFLAPSVPPTLIEEEDHIYETSFMAKDSSSIYNEEDGLWHTKVFPSDKPSSRMDAVMLDAWITRSLERYQQEISEHAGKEDFAKTVEDLVPILSISLHEIVRQVMHHCSERGVALEKIWRTYVELFHRVLSQMQESLQQQKARTTEVNHLLSEANQELRALKRSHPEHMHRIISDLELRFTRRQQGFEEELREVEQENSNLKTGLRNQHRELEIWYPGFPTYQDSYIRNLIPQHTSAELGKRRPMSHGTAADSEMAPEVAIAEDFKRLLAVLPPDKRKNLGQDLLGVIEGKEEDPLGEKLNQLQAQHKGSKEKRASIADASMEEQQQQLEQMEQLQKEVQKQEEHIKALKSEIAKLEARKAFPIDDDDEFPESEPSEEEDAQGDSSDLARASMALLSRKSDGALMPRKPRKHITLEPPAAMRGEDRDSDDSGLDGDE